MAEDEIPTTWEYTPKMGAPLKYDTAEALEADCAEYFAKRSQVVWNEQPLPFTQASLCIFLGITQDTWIRWRKDREDLSEVITRVDEIIRDNKLSGAYVGAYNSNIVARDLKLADKQDVEVNGSLAARMDRAFSRLEEK